MNPDPHFNLILAATPRLARALRQAVWQQHRMAQDMVWQAPEIQLLSTWWSALFQQAVLSGECADEDIALQELSALQERMLWERAISECLREEEAAALFNVAGLAQSAMEANQLIIEWNISMTPAEATPESTAFQAWRQRFQTLCRERQVLEPVRFRAKVLQCLQSGAVSLPASILLAGLERQSPHMQQLIALLKQRGCTVQTMSLASQPAPNVQRLALSDPMQECRVAVAWAQQQLSLGHHSRIAIVVPQLDQQRESLIRLLDEALIPHSMRLDAVETPRPYDLSLGVPLATVPIVASALTVLTCAIHARHLSQPDMSALLHSPYFSDTQALPARALLDAEMRAQLPLALQPKQWLKFLAQQQDARLSTLSQHFAALWQVEWSGKQLPSAWSVRLHACLQAVTWAQGRSLSSHEFQAHKKLLQCIDDLAALDMVLGKISASELLRRFKDVCRQDIFQVQAPDQVRLQVVGMLESFAAPLDAVWIMGMNDHQWPPAPRPNPLIPAHCQRQAQTPNADTQVQYAFADTILQRLLHSAQQVILSYALKDGDKECRMSPLITTFTPCSAPPVAAMQTLPEQWVQQLPDEQRHQSWQWLADAVAPALTSGSVVSGGTGLLKAQAICPAWAFYRYRLHAKPLYQPVHGIDAMQRGELVHAVLEQFWRGRDSVALQALSEAAVLAQLQTIAERVIQDFAQRHGDIVSAACLTLEQERMVKLTGLWVNQVERARKIPFQVRAVEQSQQQVLRNVSIFIKMDRVDTLPDGRLVLMDYKTGKGLRVKSWAKSRMDDPQLPFYAAYVLRDEVVAAVLFAKVGFDDFGFAGVAADEQFHQGVYQVGEIKGRHAFHALQFQDWQRLQQHWHACLDAIAKEITEGYAPVLFEHEADLRYCEIKPLLRLAERQLQFEHVSPP